MPELPEVETMRRGILSMVGSSVRDVASEPCLRKPILVSPEIRSFRRRTMGRRVTAVDRLGKRVVVRLDSGDNIVFEPRMTGLVLVADPPSAEHLRFRMDLAGGPLKSVWYWDRRGLGSVRLLSNQQLSDMTERKLGLDALVITAAELRERLSQSKRAIKVALLDQRALAGVGNLYASEILHRARIHPEARCDALRPAQWKRIHVHLGEVLEDAIRHEGSTLSDGTYRNALNQSGGYQNSHRVYDRADELCCSCRRGRIQRIVQAQRSTFYCAVCQRRPQ